MKGLSRSLGRMTGVLVVSSLLITQGALASGRQDDRGVSLSHFSRVKQVVVRILSELGFPPG